MQHDITLQDLQQRLNQLQSLQKLLDDAIARFEAPKALVFSAKPQKNAPNREIPPLDKLAKANKRYTEHCQIIKQVQHSTTHFDTLGSNILELSRETVAAEVKEELLRVETIARMEWEKQVLKLNGPGSTKGKRRIHTGAFDIQAKRGHPAYMAICLVVATLHLVFNVAARPCNFLLKALRVIITLATATSFPPFIRSANASQRIPIDVRTAISSSNLSPIALTSYVCCPGCCQLYLEEGDTYPDTCSCGIGLTRKKSTGRKPIRRFLYQNFQDWLARILCRPGVEELVDIKRNRGLVPVLTDIWDGQWVRDLNDTDGEWFFGRKGRYLITMGVDWLNPFGNRQARKKYSVGAMYVVVANLPRHLRYRPENICVLGIIPGPHEPKHTSQQINHFLRPFVDELENLWYYGIHLTSTPLAPHGKDIKVALGLVSADLKAARPMGGFVGDTHTILCSFCDMTIQRIEDFNPEHWNLRTQKEHNEQALAWLNAPDDESREEIERKHGVRYSELLRLPYYNVLRGTVLGPMHAHHNLLKRHIRDIWGMNIKTQDDDAEGLPAGKTKLTRESWNQALEVLMTGSGKDLEKLRHGRLEALAYTFGIRTGGKTKAQLFAELENWRCQNGVTDEMGKLKSIVFIPDEPQVAGASVVPEAIDITLGERKLGLPSSKAKDLEALPHPMLAAMCRYHELTPPGATVRVMVRQLMAWRRANHGSGDDHLRYPPPHRKGVVLGSDVLAAVRADIEATVLPSSMKPTPKKLGEASHGKLSAAEMLTAGLVSLPFTLVRLWSGTNATDRQKEMLENYMLLVASVRLGRRHVIDPEHIALHQKLLQKYLEGLLHLYPTSAISPTQHLAGHFPHNLRDWGPSFSWAEWALEYMNGLAQKLHTNSKFGEIETTMMNKLVALSNLRGLVVSGSLPKGLQDLEAIMGDVIDHHYRGALLGECGQMVDDWAVKRTGPPRPLDSEDPENRLLSDLHPSSDGWSVTFCDYVERDGIRYKVQRGAAGDGLIEFSHTGTAYAGRIDSIFILHSRTSHGLQDMGVLMRVSPLQPLSQRQAGYDPYRKFPHVGIYLVREEWSSSSLLIMLGSIRSHIATLPFAGDGVELPSRCLAIYPLSRS